MSSFKILSSTRVTRQGGVLHRCQHQSNSTACDMMFAIFLPHSYHESSPTTPALYYLSGLTCNDQNFSQKAGAFLHADAAGLALVLPDTSPRGEAVANDDAYDLGQGAGFYINATQEPWKAHFQMESYIQKELPAVINENFPGINPALKSISGHSMGGHGALTLAFKSKISGETDWKSVSAFAPICHPTACPWGKKAFENYFGSVEIGLAHDATELLKQLAEKSLLYDDILIDQGLDDEFLKEQLCLDDFESTAASVGQTVTIRRHEGMDHSYYFIAACVADHIDFHAKKLK
ncbi:S-formylglutathione hydrolase [Fistulifera solaris]|uniref:S-formylglutathione hydrolase n=1 Tax=Fistulifera solaris TaxID=1519565 RepID=A0A1Z5JNW0_FISSO|nr:S-formylglutathione hydrolase [Fistulifera solaris]|eukprot:GAX15461.1 S-formylglutathione hydrolase [Fistulifera solaris]